MGSREVTPWCWHAGYCQITCGRCPCCQTVSQVLAARGLTSFLAAVQATPLGFQLAQPGFMATVLAPTNAAFTTFLKGEAGLWTAHCSPGGACRLWPWPEASQTGLSPVKWAVCLTFCAKVQQLVDTGEVLGAFQP